MLAHPELDELATLVPLRKRRRARLLVDLVLLISTPILEPFCIRTFERASEILKRICPPVDERFQPSVEKLRPLDTYAS